MPSAKKSSQVKSSQVKSLNTIVIDHLRSEYSAWVDLLRRGHSGLRSAYGKDYLNHFMGGREVRASVRDSLR